MKITFIIPFILIICVAVALGLGLWSARLGRRVWAPKVFAWRNPLKLKPNIERHINCPMRLVSPRFYSFMTLGSAIGSVLKFEVQNVSDKLIHSFDISFLSSDPLDAGRIGVQPETALQMNQSITVGTSSRGNGRMTVRVDCVRFVDGDVWYPEPLYKSG
jgi:hypothetical protein